MDPSYEFFDHTADMGVRVRAASLPDLFRTAGQALYAAIGELAVREETEPIAFELAANDTADLLQDYLSRLLVLFESRHRVVPDVAFPSISERRLSAAGQARPLDDARSVFHREVKAITYHLLSVKRTGDQFEAVFILDI